MSTATAYNHFKNKRVLIGYVYKPLVGRLTKTTECAVAKADADPIAAIWDYFYEVTALARRRRLLTESLIAAMHEQSLRADKEADKATGEPGEDDVHRLVPLRALLTELIVNAQKRGRLRPKLPAGELGAYYADGLLRRALTVETESACETASNLLGELLSVMAVNPEGNTFSRPGDLSLALKRLMRESRAEDRRRLANSNLTREYLRIGLDLSGERGIILTDEAASGESFGRITVGEIVAKAKERGIGSASAESFRERWPSNEGYTIDLLSYSLWSRYWQPGDVENSALDLSNAPDVLDAANRVARRGLELALDSPATRLSLVAAAIANRHTELSDTAGVLRAKLRERWITVYAEMLAVNNLTLRADVDIRDFADILSLIADGLIVRKYSDSNITDRQMFSLFGKSMNAVLASCVDRGDQRELKDIARELFPAPR